MNHNPYAPPKANVDVVPAEASAPAVPDACARLYSGTQIGVAAFIGSPLAAAWFAAANFKALAQPLKARRTLIWGAAVTIVLLGIGYMLPERTPNSLLPILYSITIRMVADQVFQRVIRHHVQAGGTRGSWWRVIGVSLLFLVGIGAAAFAIMMVLFQFGILQA
jgi:hypothetical protein